MREKEARAKRDTPNESPEPGEKNRTWTEMLSEGRSRAEGGADGNPDQASQLGDMVHTNPCTPSHKYYCDGPLW